jgi:hypothetical protein
VNISPFFAAHTPAPSHQSVAVFGVALRKERDDVSVTPTLPDRLGIITTVTEHAIGCTLTA